MMYKENLVMLEARNLLKVGRFEDAIKNYELAINKHPRLRKILEFNINYAKRKNRQRTITALTTIAPVQSYENACEIVDLIQDSGLFDANWYMERYSNNYEIKNNPLEHFIRIGLNIGLNPSSLFDTQYYINANPDVKLAKVNGFLHYIKNGKFENRKIISENTNLYQKYSIQKPEYVERISPNNEKIDPQINLIAFYLPQFHAIPENDAWWGEGFTEWTNVRPAQPQFENHYQPHIPDDHLGYYNLDDITTFRKQIQLAEQYGIQGFCFYAYWFTGHRLLEKPLNSYLEDKSLNFPFCVCWANENWSRRWDGLDHDLLMEQKYSKEDDINFIKNFSVYLTDKRYIRVDGKPLLMIYRPGLFPDINATVKRWREWCRKNGVGEIYLVYPQSFECVDPDVYGFDAACEFPPNNSSPPNITNEISTVKKEFQGDIYDWRIFLERSENYKAHDYKIIRGVNPSWDNTARKKNKGIVFENSCPKLFEQLVTNAFVDTLVRNKNKSQRMVFVNAWNEWAEGAHLEPDRKYGYGWLNAIRNSHIKTSKASQVKLLVVIHAFYLDVFEEIIEKIGKWVFLKNYQILVTVNKENLVAVKHIENKYGVPFKCLTVDNRGRDVWPFFQSINSLQIKNFDYILKIHTKKSLHRLDGDFWREEIFKSLLEEFNLVRSILKLDTDETAGIVAPPGQTVPLSYYFGSNKDIIKKLCNILHIDLNLINNEINFVAGTMFLCKIELINEINNLKLKESDFPEESGQVDGTIMHAVERMFGILCCIRGKKIINLHGVEMSQNFKYAEKANIEESFFDHVS